MSSPDRIESENTRGAAAPSFTAPLASAPLGPPFLVVLDPSMPIVAAALHDGHLVRAEVAAELALTPEQRLREEDPFTARWTSVAPSRFVSLRSRFEVDLNRPREGAVYRTPAESWGLRVWRTAPDESLVQRSLDIHDAFYAEAKRVLAELAEHWGAFAVLDLHSYNHRRAGADAAYAPASENPEVNVGTGSLDRDRWGRLVDRFMNDIRGGVEGVPVPDVRENVRFRGGYFSTWVNRTFPGVGCALAVEFKKVFMDEWSGCPDESLIEVIHRRLSATIPGLILELERA